MATPGTRDTAVVELALGGREPDEMLALDVEREYRAFVRIADRTVTSGVFRSPLGDERWGEVLRAMRDATSAAAPGRTPLNRVFDAGARLRDALIAAAPELQGFLAAVRPRRLVIASDRPEIHRLPWEALHDGRRHVAQDDLSIVHAIPNEFDAAPWAAPDTLRVLAIQGPDTPGSTLLGVRELARPHDHRIVEATDGEALRRQLVEFDPTIVHLEAHGDNERATVTVAPDATLDPARFAGLIGSRPLVLLWTCFANLTQSWGESPGRSLLRQGARTVIGFSTEVRQDTAGGLADRFYRDVFDARAGGDPERVVTRQRAAAFDDADTKRQCIWASLVVWMRRPVDLSAAVARGPRLPAHAWSDDGGGADALRDVLSDAADGSHLVVRDVAVPDTLPVSLAAGYPGAVVQLRGSVGGSGAGPPLQADDIRALVERLGGPPPASGHPADAVLALLAALATYRRSLLVWTDVTDAEVAFFELYDGLPATLSVLLVPGAAAPPEPAVSTPTLASLAALVECGRFAAARTALQGLVAEADRWDAADWGRRLAYETAAFWIAVKSWDNHDADQRTRAIEALGDRADLSPETRFRIAFEWRVLRANLRSREGRFNEACELYRAALRLADDAGRDTERGRAGAELAYVRADMGDTVAAEARYRHALGLLEGATAPGDRAWRNALARTRRDLAAVLVRDPSRRDEVRDLLRRSLAGHALDGRDDQLAAVLRTRGALFAATEEHDRAETSLEAAAAIATVSGNIVGWAGTMREIAALALRRGRRDQCIGLLTRMVEQLRGFAGDIDRSPEIGLAALQLARAHWQSGRPEEARRWCREAQTLLPEPMQHERVEAENLARAAGWLVPGAPP